MKKNSYFFLPDHKEIFLNFFCKNKSTGKYNLDLYLIENILPVLFLGLEELSKEVERFQKSSKLFY